MVNGLFFFLAAAVIAVFAFLSIAFWSTAPSRERAARDRLALLKTIAEQPGENALRVLDLLRQEDERRYHKKQREERMGWISGGVITMSVGLGLGAMIFILEGSTAWSVGLIPFMVGAALFGIGLSMQRPPK